jgi:hypothetical protein
MSSASATVRISVWKKSQRYDTIVVIVKVVVETRLRAESRWAEIDDANFADSRSPPVCCSCFHHSVIWTHEVSQSRDAIDVIKGIVEKGDERWRQSMGCWMEDDSAGSMSSPLLFPPPRGAKVAKFTLKPECVPWCLAAFCVQMVMTRWMSNRKQSHDDTSELRRS